MSTAHYLPSDVTRPRPVVDGLGRELPPAPPARRIVSLVPSFTETLFALGLRDEVIGRTDYCVQPPQLVARVPAFGGTKTPHLAEVEALAPDLVIASAEENVKEHVERLIDAGLRVYVSLPLSVRRALDEINDIARLTDREPALHPWLDEARDTVAELEARHAIARAVPYFCPIWRRPYMVAGPDTYMSDLLSLCGGESVFGPGPARYYPVELAEAARRRPAVVLLPDEPYPFSAKHLPEMLAFSEMPAVHDARVHLVDGQMITWYGPRIAQHLRAAAALLEA